MIDPSLVASKLSELIEKKKKKNGFLVSMLLVSDEHKKRIGFLVSMFL